MPDSDEQRVWVIPDMDECELRIESYVGDAVYMAPQINLAYTPQEARRIAGILLDAADFAEKKRRRRR